jgi:uncharacterized protein YyaL (SSP411 family)
MEHESFEDPETAALMNALFVPIKVDREERPDLDSIYMEAVQRLTGSGGWPMTVFLTPDGRPFYGGTYFPPVPRHGLPAFKNLLTAIADAYRNRRDDVEHNAGQIAASLGEQIAPDVDGGISGEILEFAARALGTFYDPREGGFGGAPKFPQPMALEFLLRTHRRGADSQAGTSALQMAEYTLIKMAGGGIYDQLGGGFHRYSVDSYWLVPHFEKMLYDNAQLARVYAYAYQTTRGLPLYRRIAEETLRYVQREMTSPEGGFYSTQDADSEGEEGKFFIWTPAEVSALLGSEAPLFMRAFDVTPAGNFEGHNILHVARDPDVLAREFGLSVDAVEATLARGKQILFQARERRVHPGRDEKILTSWNGLMLRAFVTGAAAFGDPSYLATAEANASFLLTNLLRDGRLLRTYKDGVAKLNGYLEDYAFLADALLALYEVSGRRRWFDAARTLAEVMVVHFADPDGGPFFTTSDDHETLIHRPRDLYDNAVPSGNSVAAEVLLRLAVHTGDERYHQHAIRAIAPLQEAMARAPLAFGRLLCAADQALDPERELAIIGAPEDPRTLQLRDVATARFEPNLVLAIATPDAAAASDSPLLVDKVQRDGVPTAYLCERYACQTPVTSAEALAAQLRQRAP